MKTKTLILIIFLSISASAEGIKWEFFKDPQIYIPCAAASALSLVLVSDHALGLSAGICAASVTGQYFAQERRNRQFVDQVQPEIKRQIDESVADILKKHEELLKEYTKYQEVIRRVIVTKINEFTKTFDTKFEKKFAVKMRARSFHNTVQKYVEASVKNTMEQWDKKYQGLVAAGKPAPKVNLDYETIIDKTTKRAIEVITKKLMNNEIKIGTSTK